MRSLQELGQEVMEIMNAVNGTAVSWAMHRAMIDLLAHARARGLGTDWVNGHPVTRLYIDKLASLAGVTTEVRIQDYHWCQELAEGRDPEGVVSSLAQALVSED